MKKLDSFYSLTEHETETTSSRENRRAATPQFTLAAVASVWPAVKTWRVGTSARRSGLGEEELALLAWVGEEGGRSVTDGAHRVDQSER